MTDLRTALATICGSDVHTVRGDREAPAPLVLGHEQVGRIVALSGSPRAADASALRVGQRVVWSLTASCGGSGAGLIGLTVTAIGPPAVAVEASGHPAAVARCLETLGTGGVAVLVGSVFPAGTVPLDPETVVRRLLAIRGVHNCRPADLVAAVTSSTSGRPAVPAQGRGVICNPAPAQRR